MAKRCTLLMDSDVHGPPSWPVALEVVRSEGSLVSASIFIAEGTGFTMDTDWGKRLQELGIEPKVVPAKEASIELCAEAMRLVMEEDVNVVCLAVKEDDFATLSQKLRTAGNTAGKQFSILEIGSLGDS
ncbi:unnamed protein product [Symbiodinium pilosum]|uniref:NYN domain-containing protein n=1 Tax=Symbiodinium pilosum TaxID=2952 RepID=A0A812XDH1_SYMPI|nr:unnamed protein product [Symbiodinium pilosum]